MKKNVLFCILVIIILNQSLKGMIPKATLLNKKRLDECGIDKIARLLNQLLYFSVDCESQTVEEINLQKALCIIKHYPLLAGIPLGDSYRTPLHFAAEYSSDFLKALLTVYCETIDLKDNVGCTLLHLATYKNNVESVKELVEKGADINAVTSNRRTALHYAVFNHDSEDIIKYLLLKGANPNIQDLEGNTPLHYLAYHSRTKYVQLFFSRKVNICILNSEGKSVRDIIIDRYNTMNKYHAVNNPGELILKKIKKTEKCYNLLKDTGRLISK